MKTISVPLELINLQNDGFHILVEVVVFGNPFNVVLDTGASKTVLDKNTVEKYTASSDLLFSDKLSTGLGTDSMESFTIQLAEIKIGKIKIKNFEAAVLDLSSICLAYENLQLPPVIGVLGGDILQEYNAIINYKKLLLKLSK
ncbi:aspartyl protease family protein [Daejeonella oryzae]|uniref:aspartyl protease family protein n=1 Tax=Daejeonella oryzae TaxID=1122943 RepID=UPI00047A9A86|nr:aspartyl protease family protein [Daejeonella oryzae]